MMNENHGGSTELADAYEAPRLIHVGSVAEATLGCDKTFGDSDGFTFQGVPIHCSSA